MKLTLISPRLAVQKGDFLGSGVPYWPVELAVTASFLKNQGHQITVLDLFGSAPNHLDEKSDHYMQGAPLLDVLSLNCANQTDVYIVFAISYMSHLEICEVVRELKVKSPKAKICILENSQAVTAYALPPLAKDFFEAGASLLICGEIYWNWDEISQYLISSTSSVPSNCLAPTSDTTTPLTRHMPKHPSYPPPAWELFNLNNYWSLPYSHGPKINKKFLPIFTSRGCPYPCDFCVIPGTNSLRWRGRAAKEVVDEMIYLRDKFKVHYFQIEDVNPTVKSERWNEISKLLIEQKANVLFAFVSGTKAETVKMDQVPLLAEAGCRYISISPESGSAAVLKKIGKPFDYDHALKLISACAKAGIYTQACLIAGHPGETEEDHKLSCAYLKRMLNAGLDEVAVFVVSSLAGSKIHASSKLSFDSKGALPSFSPKGRSDWQIIEARRKELIRIFFVEKLKSGLGLWLQGLRAVFGSPRTKMENLPKRMVLIYWLTLKSYWSNRKLVRS